VEEGGVEVVAAFVADEEAPIAVEPGEGALDAPTVPAGPGAGLDALAGDAREDVRCSRAARRSRES
jgi:hypothetical protein